MRKPLRSVELDDIISSQIIGTDAEVVALVLKTHLALEALIIEMIQIKKTDDKIYKMNFPNKTELLVNEGIITLNDKQAFDRFNEFRNDLAHIFGHAVTLSDVLDLARDIEAKGIDFSDTVGNYSEKEAKEYYGGVEGVLAEIGWCLLSHAGVCLFEAGGRDISI